MAKLLVQVISGPIRKARWELRKDGTLFWWFGFWKFEHFDLAAHLTGIEQLDEFPVIPQWPPWEPIDDLSGVSMVRAKILARLMQTPIHYAFTLRNLPLLTLSIPLMDGERAFDRLLKRWTVQDTAPPHWPSSTSQSIRRHRS